MESDELVEAEKEVAEAGNRIVGLTMAIIAALLAATTLMGHRLHTEEVVVQTQSADGWAYFQAKNTRAQMYAADARLADLSGEKAAGLVEAWNKKAEDERHDAEQIRHDTEQLDKRTEETARRATFFDIAEICLEVAIVLCSVTLLTRTKGFWLSAFVPTLAGVALAVYGLLV